MEQEKRKMHFYKNYGGKKDLFFSFKTIMGNEEKNPTFKNNNNGKIRRNISP